MKDKVHFKRLFSFLPEQRNYGSSAGRKDDELQYEIKGQGGKGEGVKRDDKRNHDSIPSGEMFLCMWD